MSNSLATSAIPRKAPKQRRSRATVDAILTATAQVLVERGYDKATTNVIAKRAGVSIGSLYQYFPNKEALVTALCQRHSEHVCEQISTRLATTHDLPLPLALRGLIKLLLAHHAEEPELHRVLIEQVPRLSGFEQLAMVNCLLVETITADLQRRRETLRPRNLELAAFILVHSVQAVTHAAVLERPEALDDEALADEIVDLVRRYLVDDSSRAHDVRLAAE
jgi:AcrR family transcriptional regulator